MHRSILAVLTATYLVTSAAAQTWCNKHYMVSQPQTPPGGEFPLPPPSTTALLSLRCAPAIRPYLPEDALSASNNEIIIDTPVRFSHISGAVPITLDSTAPVLAVTVSVDGKTLTTGNVPLNATKHALPFSLSSLTPRAEPYNISCTAILPSSSSSVHQTFLTSAALTYLPSPSADIGSVTKMDLRTGALLARPADGKGGDFAPVFPIGFYTQFDGYLTPNLSVIDELKEQGFTVIHPIPSFDNLTALNQVLDRMQEVGLYLMYDMRNTYMNATSVIAQVNNIKSRPNLLLWYTADEPDGTSDPLNATSNAYNLITSLDGGPPLSSSASGSPGYHPISLVLNCQNFEWSAYTSGSDVVLQDTYMIGNNVTFSSQWGTPCTVDYGDCGCDNCVGDFEDISTRMDEFRDRLFINGWDRTKAVWTVPQGFGNESYWTRYPTGKEWVVQSVVGINHGGLGVVSWDDPTPADIKSSASSLAKALPTLTPFIFNPTATFQPLTINRIDIALWTVNSQTLVLAANLNYQEVSLDLGSLPSSIGSGVSVNQVFDSGAKMNGNGFTFEEVGTGAWILAKNGSGSEAPQSTSGSKYQAAMKHSPRLNMWEREWVEQVLGLYCVALLLFQV